MRYVANHVLLAQGLIREIPLKQIYAELPEKYKLGDQILSALFTEDEKYPVSYNQSSDMGRAIGLWLWEYKQQHPETPKQKSLPNWQNRCQTKQEITKNYHSN